LRRNAGAGRETLPLAQKETLVISGGLEFARASAEVVTAPLLRRFASLVLCNDSFNFLKFFFVLIGIVCRFHAVYYLKFGRRNSPAAVQLIFSPIP